MFGNSRGRVLKPPLDTQNTGNQPNFGPSFLHSVETPGSLILLLREHLPLSSETRRKEGRCHPTPASRLSKGKNTAGNVWFGFRGSVISVRSYTPYTKTVINYARRNHGGLQVSALTRPIRREVSITLCVDVSRPACPRGAGMCYAVSQLHINTLRDAVVRYRLTGASPQRDSDEL